MPQRIIRVPRPTISYQPVQADESDADLPLPPTKPPGSGGSGAPAAPQGPCDEPEDTTGSNRPFVLACLRNA